MLINNAVIKGSFIVNGVDGEPILQFEKDAVYASYVNAFKELKGRLEVVEAILKNNNLM